MRIGEAGVGRGRPLVVIAGPCVIESESMVLRLASALRAICAAAGVQLVFKASFDKANRTSLRAFRGPGLDEGLRILRSVRERLDLPVTTDLHLPSQAAAVADAVDLLQIPAFLCRQTDLLVAEASPGRPVNVKKGQFMAPADMRHVVDKLTDSGAGGVLLTERGTTFGYHGLVADLTSIPEMQALGVPVCFDATHAVQRPGAAGGHSGGRREHAPVLARAAVAAGADAVFLEVHEDPDKALSDAATQLPLTAVPALLDDLVRLAAVVRHSEANP